MLLQVRARSCARLRLGWERREVYLLSTVALLDGGGGLAALAEGVRARLAGYERELGESLEEDWESSLE
jgi:hypothetical protein